MCVCVCVQYNFTLLCFTHRVEKYRPKSLDDLISHKDILTTSKCKHLFYGR